MARVLFLYQLLKVENLVCEHVLDLYVNTVIFTKDIVLLPEFGVPRLFYPDYCTGEQYHAKRFNPMLVSFIELPPFLYRSSKCFSHSS